MNFVLNVTQPLGQQHSDVVPATGSTECRVNLTVSETILVDDQTDSCEGLTLRFVHRHAIRRLQRKLYSCEVKRQT